MKEYKVCKAEEALEGDIAKVKDRDNIEVEYAASITGGSSIYRLTDLADGKRIGNVELGRSDYYPGEDRLYHQGELQEKLGEMLNTPIEQLKRLVESDAALHADRDKADESWGVNFYKPTALPLESRIPDGKQQILYATTEYFDEDCYTSSKRIGEIMVKISEYLPGRHNYHDEGIYQKDGLREAFTQDSKIFLAYVGRILNNAKYYEKRDKGFPVRIDWAEKAENLSKDFPEVFKEDYLK